jgi:hypothetical protein
MTGEHIWSDWMNKLFPMSGVTFQGLGQDGSVTKQWPARNLNLKTKVVCGPCNNGWMSLMERDFAEPAMTDLILGNHIGELSRKRARGLSLFAFKTAVIVNRSLPQTEWFFTSSERYAFRKSLAIPNDVTMFLVGMEDVKGAGGAGGFNVSYPDRSLSLNICSFWVGQLGFQVVSARGFTAQKVESMPTPPSELTIRFYPELDLQVRWPRKRVLSVREFHDFSSRWNKIRR